MRRSPRRALAIAVLWAVSFAAPAPVAAELVPIQLTSNELIDIKPDISGGAVVFVRYVPGYQVFRWLGGVTTAITTQAVGASDPRVSGSNVVWSEERYDGSNDTEIYFFDGTTITRVTNNSVYDYTPDVSGNRVVWVRSPSGSDREIYLWDGTTTVNLSNNATDDVSPAIDGVNVVWSSGDGNDTEILFWNGSTITAITDDETKDANPAISGSNVAWECRGGGTLGEICAFVDGQLYQITDDSQRDQNPDIFGSRVVWQCHDGTAFQLCSWDGTSTTQLTSTPHHKFGPRLTATAVTWGASVDGLPEIFLATLPGTPPPPATVPALPGWTLAVLAALLAAGGLASRTRGSSGRRFSP